MIAIVDYHAGNLTSVRLALEAAGVGGVVTSSPEAVAAADRVIFPGVGAAAFAMKQLGETGLDQAIRRAIDAGRPFLGICLGMQILFERSDEDGGTDMLGILPGEVRRFRPASPRDKIPHMGWNQVSFRRRHPVFEGVAEGSDFYFVHSFYPAPAEEADAICKTRFAGVDFASAVARGNVVATQFHVEKSGGTGLRVLANFLKWDGKEGA